MSFVFMSANDQSKPGDQPGEFFIILHRLVCYCDDNITGILSFIVCILCRYKYVGITYISRFIKWQCKPYIPDRCSCAITISDPFQISFRYWLCTSCPVLKEWSNIVSLFLKSIG